MSDHSKKSDELFARAKSGDGDAMGELCALVIPPLTRYVESKMGTRANRWTNPADVVQNVLIELDAIMDFAENYGMFIMALRRRARWRLLDEIDRNAHAAGESEIRSSSHNKFAVVKTSTGTVTRNDDRTLLRHLRSKLSGRYGEVVELCAIQGLPFSQAAQKLDTTTEAVRKAYQRANAILKTMRPKQDP